MLHATRAMSVEGHNTRSIIQVCDRPWLDVVCYKGVISVEGHDTRSIFQVCD